MIKKLIAAVIAFLAGTLITHRHWYKVNLRLQATHKRNLDDRFNHTYQRAYSDGHAHGIRDEQFAQFCREQIAQD